MKKTPTANVVKKKGRKPLPEDRRRVGMGVRVDPGTKDFLKSLDPYSTGRAIDRLVAAAIRREFTIDG